jgi:hypothetical protein
LCCWLWCYKTLTGTDFIISKIISIKNAAPKRNKNPPLTA